MTNTAAQPAVKYRKDYQPTPYAIDKIALEFDLREDATTVTATSTVSPREPGADMFLNGRSDVELESLQVNGADVSSSSYTKTDASLTLRDLPSEPFELRVVTRIKPQDNSSLEGLYKSGGNFCTQCEAEGFRGITFFYDRPDVMSTYTVRVEADRGAYPVLLSNGNLVDSGDASEGRHFTVWEDPWPKPCYLFALVAGNLKSREDSFTTASGREVRLAIYVQEQNVHKVDFAMASLKEAMRWDEERYGLEYDLDLFNIVAVDDFNMGAMENKSLNVFNSRLVLASPETATDTDFARIQGVVGHEYFHNWTGNRVTCRDWFQLTLKEGLTVYRDSEFTSDLNSRAVKRIEDVTIMRTAQFAEDAGPIAHPIRPDSYIKMDNFYTVTVYEKGCEVIRMYETILGRDGFRKGMDLYFQRHDGSAVTCDDFLAAMSDANEEDLSALAKWYGQAGTPRVTISTEFDPASRTYVVTVDQVTRPTKDQPDKVPVMIPVVTGLLASDGSEMAFTVTEGRAKQRKDTEAVLLAEGASSKFVLSGVEEAPVPSFLRNFSAPVVMTVPEQTDEQLLFLLAHDTDPFNRWDAGQRMARKVLLKLYNAAHGAAPEGREDAFLAAGGVDAALVQAFRSLLTDPDVDGSTVAMAITLPGQSELVQEIDEADPELVHEVRKFAVRAIAQQLMPELVKAVKANQLPPGTEYSPDAASVAKRALKNKALAMLCATGEQRFREQAVEAYRAATNMTDMMASVMALIDVDCSERKEMLDDFYSRWQKDSLVVLKWISMQATSNKPGNLAEVRALVDHPAFNISNPNNCYSLFLAMARSAVTFHAPDGSGYEFMADMVMKVDGINRQVAARMAGAFTGYKQLDKKRQGLIQDQLKRIAAHEGLSENVAEIVGKSIEA